METYHRKRSKRDTISANNEIMSFKRQEKSSILAGAQTQTSPSARQILLQTNDEVPGQEVELGSIYEIYHKNLPPRTPVQLKSTRVVMVSEKIDRNLAIRYPSIASLRTYFSNGVTEMYPALDEKFVMGMELAGKVLFRQVPSQEFAEKKHMEDFWVVNSNSQIGFRQLVTKIEDIGLAKELKNNEMVRWGVRRQVMFIRRHKEMSKTHSSSSSFVQGDDEGKDQEIKDELEVDEDDDEDDEEETHEYNLKRKLKCNRNLRKRKRAKPANQLWQVNKKPMKKCKKLAVIRDPTDRWSKERYMAAEQSLLEAMKEKKAMIGNPITRPALRVEARKRIGDTGLLDHLLKHVANKVAPGGTLRFRRSHNADGAMEYWLEKADLLKIRKDAGVKDPFWTPPPGWKPGDTPIQDPIMAKEINQLKEEISNIKRGMEELVSQKQFEEEMAALRREIEELIPENKEENPQTMVVFNPEQLGLRDSLVSSESDVVEDKSAMSMEKCMKQMLVISDFLKMIEERMDGEVGKMERRKTELISSPRPSSSIAENYSEKAKEAVALPKEASIDEAAAPAVVAEGEGKAAKIERLKSGFRICRPQGTFLWPNMVSSANKNTTSFSSCWSQVVEVVPTPPSVNSSTPAPHHLHLHLPSPVKPVPERRPVTVTLSTSSTATTTIMPNLQVPSGVNFPPKTSSS